MKEACRDWVERLSAWFDEEAAELEAEEVRAHLMACPGCRARITAWRSLREDLACLQPEEPSPQALERMFLRFEESLTAEVGMLARGLRLWRLAAATLLLAGAGLFAAREAVLPGRARASGPIDFDEAMEQLFAEPSAPPPAGTSDEAPDGAPEETEATEGARPDHGRE